MGFGVDKKESVEGKKIVKAITAETIVALAVIAAVFGEKSRHPHLIRFPTSPRAILPY